MHDETMRELIEGGTAIAGSLAKEMLVHRSEMSRMEAQKERDLELARIRQEAAHEHEPEPSPPEPAMGVSGMTPSETEAAIDELIAEEQCSVCKQLLEHLKERGPHQQIRGVMEYGQFKKELSEGAGVEELKSLLRETVVLHSIFEEDIRGPPV